MVAVVSRFKGMLTLDIPEGKTQLQSNYLFFLVIADIRGLSCWIWVILGHEDGTAETKTLGL